MGVLIRLCRTGFTARRSTISIPPRGATASFTENGSKQPIANDPFEALVDPHAPARLSRNLTEGWFFNVLPDLNTENPDGS